MKNKNKFSGRCKHGKVPGDCEICNPPLSKEEIMRKAIEFLKQLDERNK